MRINDEFIAKFPNIIKSRGCDQNWLIGSVSEFAEQRQARLVFEWVIISKDKALQTYDTHYQS
jgi:hypothetical protein